MTCAIHDETDELGKVFEDDRRFAALLMTRRQRRFAEGRFVGDNLLQPSIDRNVFVDRDVFDRNVVVEGRRCQRRAEIDDGRFRRIISVFGRNVGRTDI